MPRFFFPTHDGVHKIDTVGTELPDIEAAKREAVTYVAEALKDNAAQFWDGQGWSVDVCNEHNLLLFTLNFVAAMAPALSGSRGVL